MSRPGKNGATAHMATMTDTKIQEARERLKKLKEGPPPDQRKNSGRGIVEKLYEQVAAARAAGWNWERIKQEIGEEVAGWKPETLERYFQLARNVRGLGGRTHEPARSGASKKENPGESRNGKASRRSGSSERERGENEPPGNKYNPDVV